jgi:hypothetical protein
MKVIKKPDPLIYRVSYDPQVDLSQNELLYGLMIRIDHREGWHSTHKNVSKESPLNFLLVALQIEAERSGRPKTTFCNNHPAREFWLHFE